MTRTKKMIWNSVSSGIQVIFSIVVGLVIPRLIIGYYGSELNGLTVSIKQFVAYLAYLEAGLGASFIYSLFKPLSKNDKSEINEIVSQARRSYVRTSIYYLIGVAILSSIYPFIINSDEISYIFAFILVFSIGVAGVFELQTLSKYKVILVADQKVYIISFTSLITLVFNLIFTIILVKIHASIIFVMLIPLISLFVRVIILNLYVKKHYSYINYKGKSIKKASKKRFDAMLMEVSKSINLTLPVIVITIFGSLSTISVYSIYAIIFSGLKKILHVITSGVVSTFGNIIAKEETEILKKTISEYSTILFFTISFLYSCALILIIPFLTIYLSGIPDSSIYINLVYGILFVAWGLSHNARLSYTSLIEGAGLYKESRKANIFQIIFITIFLLAFVPTYGITGALIVLIVGATIKTVWLIGVVRKYVIKLSIFSIFSLVMRSILVIFISYIPFIFWFKLNPQNVIEFVFDAVIVGLWVLVISMLNLLLFDRKNLKAIISRFYNLVYKKKERKC
ncbi:MAG: hypothetical protein JEZ05_00850 [Tenericutes bacterium]|nr:hypothetical protein [Mycoplasmatota bacterium]